MNNPTTEQIRVVAIYHIGEQWYNTYVFNNKPIPKYSRSLDQIAPVYRKVMGELDALCNQLADSGSQYWVHAAELIGGLKVSISDLDPLAIFHACYEAIVFIQKHSNEKDNNPA